MSWKSLVTAGLFLVLASPAFAVGPTLGLVTGGSNASNRLDANSNYVWSAQVTADQTNITGGTPVAVELGFTSNKNLVTVANATPATFDAANPGNVIFSPTWETTYGSPAKPEGLEVNCTGCTVTPWTAAYPTTGAHPTTLVAGATNQIFAALGSGNITASTPQNLLGITVTRPVTPNAATDYVNSITVSGAYSGKGRIAQYDPAAPTTTKNFDTFGGTGFTFTQTARGGDTNLDGTISIADYSTLAASYNQPGTKQWFNGDFNGDNTVSIADYSMLAANFGSAHDYNPGIVASGAGLGAGSAVPEPASVALIGLALLGGLGIIRRR